MKRPSRFGELDKKKMIMIAVGVAVIGVAIYFVMKKKNVSPSLVPNNSPSLVPNKSPSLVPKKEAYETHRRDNVCQNYIYSSYANALIDINKETLDSNDKTKIFIDYNTLVKRAQAKCDEDPLCKYVSVFSDAGYRTHSDCQAIPFLKEERNGVSANIYKKI